MTPAPGLMETTHTTAGQQPDAPLSRRARTALVVMRLRARVTRMRRTAVLVATVAVLMLGVLIGVNVDPQEETATTAPATATTSPSAVPSVTDIYEQALASVVVVTTDRNKLGSGVVANEDGEILTAAHVVSGATSIELTFSDGTTTTARVASTDAATDIASLEPASLPQTLVPATIGGKVEVGASIIAIGNPLGLAASVSTGIVSGLDRDTMTADGDFTGLIQFDASVNPGSSGGPLLDADGSVVGIVVSIADPGNDDAFAGIGFAVPVGSALGGGDGDDPGTGQQGPQV